MGRQRRSALGSGNGGIHALAVSGTDLYAGGQFNTAGGVPASNIAKWNGSAWSALGSGMDDQVLCVGRERKRTRRSGTWFTTAGGVLAIRIAKWNLKPLVRLGLGHRWSD